MKYLNRQRFVKSQISKPHITTNVNENNANLSFIELEMKNTSLQTIQEGFIVKLDENEENAVTLFPKYSPYQIHPFGIAKTEGKTNELVQVITTGIINIQMDQNKVNIGDFLYNSATPGLATAHNDAFTGVIGRALSAKSSGGLGTVRAIVGFLGYY